MTADDGVIRCILCSSPVLKVRIERDYTSPEPRAQSATLSIGTSRAPHGIAALDFLGDHFDVGRRQHFPVSIPRDAVTPGHHDGGCDWCDR